LLKLKNSAENKKDFSEMTGLFAFAKFNKAMIFPNCSRMQYDQGLPVLIWLSLHLGTSLAINLS